MESRDLVVTPDTLIGVGFKKTEGGEQYEFHTDGYSFIVDKFTGVEGSSYWVVNVYMDKDINTKWMLGGLLFKDMSTLLSIIVAYVG